MTGLYRNIYERVAEKQFNELQQSRFWEKLALIGFVFPDSGGIPDIDE